MTKRPVIFPEELARQIAIVEAAKKTISPIQVGNPESWDAYKQSSSVALDNLAQQGARWRLSGDTISLTFGGIRSTSTGGASGVLGNWLVAARKRLERCS